MSVTVMYAGQARDAAGTASETAASTSVAALLRELAGRRASLKPFLLRADGTPHPSLLVVVGDEQVRVDDPRPLRDGDVVTVMTPIAGG
ncbi:MAG TPA: MoaD/ThiS family protein [Planctomycetota bacterium]